MKHKFFKIIIIFFISISVFAQDFEKNELNEIIDKILKAYGLEVGSLSTSYRLEANITAHVRKKTGTVIRISEGSSNLKVLIDYSTDKEIRILKNNNVLRGPSFDQLVPVSGPMKESVILQAKRACLPWILLENTNKITIENIDKNYITLKIFYEEDMSLRIFIDANTYIISKTEASLVMGQNTITFKTEYYDYRRIEGIKFPFKEENYTSGVHTATTIIKSIDFNPSQELRELIQKTKE